MILRKYLFFLLTLLLTGPLLSQNPGTIKLENPSGGAYTGLIKELCHAEGLKIVHNGDESFSDDPDKSTPAGIGYLVTRNRPTTAAGSWADLSSSAVKVDGTPVLLIGANQRGLIFNNTAEFKSRVGGNSIIYLTPIILYDINAAKGGNPRLENDYTILGSQSVKVTLYDQIEYHITSIAEDKFSFSVSGGKGPTYDIMVTDDNANLPNDVTNFHDINSSQSISVEGVDEGSNLIINISDGLCNEEFIYTPGDFENYSPSDPRVISAGCVSGKKGEEIQIPIYFNNFSSFTSTDFFIRYDKSVLTYTGSWSSGSGVTIDSIVIKEEKGKFQALNIYLFEMMASQPSAIQPVINLNFSITGNPGEYSVISATDPYSSYFLDPTGSGYFSFFSESCYVTVNEENENLQASYSLCSTANGGTLQIENITGPPPYTIVVKQNGSKKSEESFSDPSIELNLSGLSSGDLDLELTDGNGNTWTQSVPYDPNRVMDFMVETSDATCDNDNGTISISDIQGYNRDVSIFLLSEGEAKEYEPNDQNEILLEYLPPGEYVVQMKDQLGCEIEEQVTIKDLEGPEVIIDYDHSVVPCGDTPASVTVTIDARSYQRPPNGRDSVRTLTISYDNIILTSRYDVKLPYITTLNPGNTFNVVIEDYNGCKGGKEFTLESESDSEFVEKIVTNPTCFPRDTESQEYLEIIFNNDYQNLLCKIERTDNIFYECETFNVDTEDGKLSINNDNSSCSKMRAGKYEITIEHESICNNLNKLVREFTVDEITVDELVFTKMDACPDSGEKGSVTIENVIYDSADELNFEVIIDNGTPEVITSFPYVVSELDNGSYRLSVRDTKYGCKSEDKMLDIGNGPAAQIGNTKNTTCPNTLDGYVTYELEEGAEISSVELFLKDQGPVERIDNPTDKTVEFTGLTSGTYYIEVTDINGCVATKGEVTLTSDNELPSFFYFGDIIEQPKCQGDTIMITVDASDLQGSDGSGISFAIDDPDENSSLAVGMTFAEPLASGLHNLYLFDGMCWSKPYEFEVEDVPPVLPVITGPSVVEFGEGGVEYEYDPDVITAGVSTHTWYYDGMQDYGNPIEIDSITSDLELILLVEDLNGCVGTDTFYVEAFFDHDLNLSQGVNVFSPNYTLQGGTIGEGDNSVFNPFTQPYVESVETFDVYNRKGELVWSYNPSFGAFDGWDGIVQRNPGQYAPMGVYMYVARVRLTDTSENSPAQVYKGEVTLLHTR